MQDLARQTPYWDSAGATKTFTHPLNPAWLAGVSRTARVLDYGCGYGRIMVELVAELDRVLAPGGLIYVSDLVLQSDERNQRRYAAYARAHDAPYGVFATDDGAVCRHHDAEHLRGLLSGFDLVHERHIDVATMNGRQASAVQLLARK